jgi:hypothetical protein
VDLCGPAASATGAGLRGLAPPGSTAPTATGSPILAWDQAPREDTNLQESLENVAFQGLRHPQILFGGPIHILRASLHVAAAQRRAVAEGRGSRREAVVIDG